MTITKALSLAVLSLFAPLATPVYAASNEPIVDLERDQIDNKVAAAPYRMHGTDKPVAVQEQETIGDASANVVDPVSAKGGRSPGAIEQQALPGAE